MQIDLQEHPSGVEFNSDVCIVGAGVAGLLMADRLRNSGFTVNLLEAGGRHDEASSQDLYACEMQGRYYRGAEEGRFRTFGGSSTRWAGQLLPYTDDIFRARAPVDDISWPISTDDIERHYLDILRVMGANDLPFSDRFLDKFERAPGMASDEVSLRYSKWAPVGRRNFAKTLGKNCLAADRVTVFFHANAVAINLKPDGRSVAGIGVRNYGEGRFLFRARHYVLACGTIEVSRLLLNSTGVCAAGVGNDHDQVGRYFYDHLSANVATLPRESWPEFIRYFAPYYVRGTLHTPRLEASEHVQKSLDLLAVMANFHIEEPVGSAIDHFRKGIYAFQKGKVSLDTAGRTLLAVGGVSKTLLDLALRGRRIPSARANVVLRIDAEQKPRADSRIRLAGNEDALGLKRAAIDWKCSMEENQSLHRYIHIIRDYLQRVGLRHIVWDQSLLDDPSAWTGATNDIFHPMGGARMGTSPASSVVNGDLQVHGIADLYVASCAVFPSGGSSNPTFTLMALALRLCEKLKGESAA